MMRKKKAIAKVFFVLAVAIVVVPICASLILEFGFQTHTTRGHSLPRQLS